VINIKKYFKNNKKIFALECQLLYYNYAGLVAQLDRATAF
jgi:hypothetical protein